MPAAMKCKDCGSKMVAGTCPECAKAAAKGGKRVKGGKGMAPPFPPKKGK